MAYHLEADQMFAWKGFELTRNAIQEIN
jgi:hypothetical protein